MGPGLGSSVVWYCVLEDWGDQGSSVILAHGAIFMQLFVWPPGFQRLLPTGCLLVAYWLPTGPDQSTNKLEAGL